MASITAAPESPSPAEMDQPEDAGVESSGAGQAKRLTAALLGLIAFLVLVQVLGFIISLTLYLLYLCIGVMRMAPVPSLQVSVGTMAFIYVIFSVLLSIPFPRGAIGV